MFDDEPLEPLGAIDDERLRLIFTCCHPALAMDSRVALTLRMVGGLTVPEIARAFLVQETTMARRITRAKAKIRAARIPLPGAVDATIWRHASTACWPFSSSSSTRATWRPDPTPTRCVRPDGRGDPAHPPDPCPPSGRRRGRGDVGPHAPDRGPPPGSRVVERRTGHPRRAGPRRLGSALVSEGHALVRERVASGIAPGRYQLLAAINAVHTSARDIRDTDWSQIVALYDQLVRLDPSPIVGSQPGDRGGRARRAGGGAGIRRPARRGNWRGITPTTRPAPTCCAGWAAVRSRAPPTIAPSSWRATRPSRST